MPRSTSLYSTFRVPHNHHHTPSDVPGAMLRAPTTLFSLASVFGAGVVLAMDFEGGYWRRSTPNGPSTFVIPLAVDSNGFYHSNVRMVSLLSEPLRLDLTLAEITTALGDARVGHEWGNSRPKIRCLAADPPWLVLCVRGLRASRHILTATTPPLPTPLDIQASECCADVYFTSSPLLLFIGLE